VATLRSIAQYVLPEQFRTNNVTYDVSRRTMVAWLNRQNEVVVWDVAADRQVARMNWLTTDKKDLRFSPDERLLAGITEGAEPLTLWDLEHDGKHLESLPKSADPVFFFNSNEAIKFSPDSRLFAVGCWDGTLEVWDLIRKTRIAMKSAHHQPVVGVGFGPHNEHLVTAGDAVVKLWEIDGHPLKTFPRTRQWFLSLAMSPDGKRIAAGTEKGIVAGKLQGFVKMWNVATGQEVATLRSRETVNALEFLGPDGDTLASLSPNELHLWRAPSWTEIDAVEARADTQSR
jgi:WD40 repeat protein